MDDVHYLDGALALSLDSSCTGSSHADRSGHDEKDVNTGILPGMFVLLLAGLSFRGGLAPCASRGLPESCLRQADLLRLTQRALHGRRCFFAVINCRDGERHLAGAESCFTIRIILSTERGCASGEGSPSSSIRVALTNQTNGWASDSRGWCNFTPSKCDRLELECLKRRALKADARSHRYEHDAQHSRVSLSARIISLKWDSTHPIRRKSTANTNAFCRTVYRIGVHSACLRQNDGESYIGVQSVQPLTQWLRLCRLSGYMLFVSSSRTYVTQCAPDVSGVPSQAKTILLNNIIPPPSRPIPVAYNTTGLSCVWH